MGRVGVRAAAAAATCVLAVLTAAVVPADAGRQQRDRQAAAAVVPVVPLVSLDLPYAADGEPAHRLDLVVPGGYDTPRPLVVFIHGGSWAHGSKSALMGGTGERADVLRDVLLSHGYAVASVGYRFSQVATFPAQLHDVKAATRFLRSRARDFNLDPDRFAVAGQSAGGHLAMLLAYTGRGQDPYLEGRVGVTGVSSAVSAVVSYYGVSSLEDLFADRRASRCPVGQTGAASPEGRLIGGDPEAPRMRRVVERADPVSYIGITSPPTMLLHGQRDCLVPARQSQRVKRMLDGVGVRNEYITLNAPHGGPLFHTTPRVTGRVLAFLDRALGVDRSRP